MNEKIFTKNISLLQKTNPTFAARIKACQPDEQWQVLPAKRGLYTLKGKTLHGKEMLLHSVYDPAREAEQLVNTYTYSPTADLVFLGFALGYHACKILQRAGKREFILIAEQDIRIVRLAFENTDLENILKQPKVIWFVDEPFPRLFNLLTEYSLSILANGVTILEHPASIQLNSHYYFNIKRVVSEAYTWSKVNMNTQIAQADTFANNILANMLEIIKNPGVRHLFGAGAGSPVFIVSAGPSLDKNVHYLKEVQGRGIIIAVDSALRTLLDKGIVPDLIVSIDFSEHNIKYLEGIDSSRLVLVFDPEVHPDIPKNFRGRKFVINLTSKSLCEWITSITEDKGRVEKGLSVSHTAFYLALHMKAHSIIFLGQDLSYPRSTWHSKGSHMYQKANVSEEMKKRKVDVEGYFGGIVESETSLKVFLTHFESILEGIDIDCYNATEGGALIGGLKPISLRDAIRRFCTQPVDKSVIWENTFEMDVDASFKALYYNGLKIVEKLTRCNHSSYQAFQYIEQMLKEINKTRWDRTVMLGLYQKVITAIKEFSDDQEVLQVMKDNAIEALLIRARREIRTLSAGNIENKEELQDILNKERLFFTSLVKASDFLSQRLCIVLNDIKTNCFFDTVDV